MAEPALRELLTAVRELELVARRNVSSLLAGNYLTTIPGQGIEFHEARRYVPGEPARSIDWKMTARLGRPYVRVHLEERQREIFVALDVSPSMHAGWQQRTKLETAVELAATLAVSAVGAGDRLGLLTFADRVLLVMTPRPGRRQLFRVLKALVAARDAAPRPAPVSDPRAAIHAVQRLRGRRFVIFLISDFIDHDLPDDLRYVQRRHDLSLLHVYDPLEYGPPGPVRLAVRSPEGAAGWSVLRPGATGDLAAMEAFLERTAGRQGVARASISTADPVGGALADFFHRKRRRFPG